MIKSINNSLNSLNYNQNISNKLSTHNKKNFLKDTPLIEKDILDIKKLKNNPTIRNDISNNETFEILPIERVGDFTEIQNPNAFKIAQSIKSYVSNIDDLNAKDKDSILNSLNNIFKSSGEGINFSKDSVGFYIGIKSVELYDTINELIPENHKAILGEMVSEFSNALIDHYLHKKFENIEVDNTSIKDLRNNILTDKNNLMSLYDLDDKEKPLKEENLLDLFNKKEEELSKRYYKEFKSKYPKLDNKALNSISNLKTTLNFRNFKEDFFSNSNFFISSKNYLHSKLDKFI